MIIGSGWWFIHRHTVDSAPLSAEAGNSQPADSIHANNQVTLLGDDGSQLVLDSLAVGQQVSTYDLQKTGNNSISFAQGKNTAHQYPACS
ncbi:MAG: hypothetical protein QM664_02840 [Flavihumibacter sp.]